MMPSYGERQEKYPEARPTAPEPSEDAKKANITALYNVLYEALESTSWGENDQMLRNLARELDAYGVWAGPPPAGDPTLLAEAVEAFASILSYFTFPAHPGEKAWGASFMSDRHREEYYQKLERWRAALRGGSHQPEGIHEFEHGELYDYPDTYRPGTSHRYCLPCRLFYDYGEHLAGTHPHYAGMTLRGASPQEPGKPPK